jgi:hypothetical protein
MTIKMIAPIYRRLARAWNFAVSLSPVDPFWQRTLWAIGRVPSPREGVAPGA